MFFYKYLDSCLGILQVILYVSLLYKYIPIKIIDFLALEGLCSSLIIGLQIEGTFWEQWREKVIRFVIDWG